MVDVECGNCGHWERHHDDVGCTLMLPEIAEESFTDVRCDCPGVAPIPSITYAEATHAEIHHAQAGVLPELAEKEK